MLDNLRDQSSSSFFQDEGDDNIPESPDPKTGSKKSRKFTGKFLGLKPQQLFILLLMSFMVVCLLGTMFLLVTGKILPPFLMN
jgi:hypothetical protein